VPSGTAKVSFALYWRNWKWNGSVMCLWCGLSCSVELTLKSTNSENQGGESWRGAEDQGNRIDSFKSVIVLPGGTPA
jgi:hypothetical protein